MVTILQEPNEILRSVSREVPIEHITSKAIQKILSDMKKGLYSQSDGVAIAAPQIGIPMRIFMVAGSVFQKKRRDGELVTEPDRVFINPVLTKLSKETKWMPGEGCLSVRWKYGKTKRHIRVSVEAYNERGEKFGIGASGLLAHICQHEIDHLNGILFIDHAKDVKDLPEPGTEEEIT